MPRQRMGRAARTRQPHRTDKPRPRHACLQIGQQPVFAAKQMRYAGDIGDQPVRAVTRHQR